MYINLMRNVVMVAMTSSGDSYPSIFANAWFTVIWYLQQLTGRFLLEHFLQASIFFFALMKFFLRLLALGDVYN